MSENKNTDSSPTRLFSSAVRDVRRQQIINACSDAFTKHKKIVPRRKAPSPLMPQREIILMTPKDFAIEDVFDDLVITDELPCEELKSSEKIGMTTKMENIEQSPQRVMANDSSIIGFYNQGSFRDDFRGLDSMRYFTFNTEEGHKLIGSWVTKEDPAKKINRQS